MPSLKLNIFVIASIVAIFIAGRLSAPSGEPHLKWYCGTAKTRKSLNLDKPAAELKKLRVAASAASNRFDAIEEYLSKHSRPVIVAALATPVKGDFYKPISKIDRLDCLMIEAGMTDRENFGGESRMYSLKASGGLTATKYVYFFNDQLVLEKAALWYMGL